MTKEGLKAKAEAKKIFDKFSKEAITIKSSGKYIDSERNALNPFPGLTFISIHYYNYSGAVYGIAD